MKTELDKLVKPRVREFCELYLQNGGNGTVAALAAGYGSRTEKGRHVAAQTASRLLRQDSTRAGGKRAVEAVPATGRRPYRFG